MDFLLIIVVLDPDFDDDMPDDDDLPMEDGSRFGVNEGLFLITGHVILADDLDGVDNFLPVIVCEALEVLAIGEKLGAGFASRSRILFILGLELAPSDPMLFLFDMFVVFCHVRKNDFVVFRRYYLWLIGKRYQRFCVIITYQYL